MALKSAFQTAVRPLARALARLGVSPNAVTLATVVGTCVVGGLTARYAARQRALLALPAWMLARLVLNTVDGMMAVAMDRRTALGAILNEVGDIIADAALILPLSCVPGVASWPVVVAVVLAGATEHAGLAPVLAGRARRYDGPMAKPDRIALFGLLALALGFGAQPGRWVDAVVCAACGLLLLTLVRRVRRGATSSG